VPLTVIVPVCVNIAGCVEGGEMVVVPPLMVILPIATMVAVVDWLAEMVTLPFTKTTRPSGEGIEFVVLNVFDAE